MLLGPFKKPICKKCQKPVDSLEIWKHPLELTHYFRVSCHGKSLEFAIEVSAIVTAKRIEMRELEFPEELPTNAQILGISRGR